VLEVSVWCVYLFFYILDAVLCKTVLTNCLLKAEAFCWVGGEGVIAGLSLIVIMILGVDGVFFLFSRYIVFHKV